MLADRLDRLGLLPHGHGERGEAHGPSAEPAAERLEDGAVEPVERFAFYDMARKAYAVIQTGERRFYGCFMFRKGVIPPEA